ncbi:hybrid sensor histidine kinase/response regulator transcription factor [Polaribacter aquimarinus]|uniref:histidine kinase n=1 Tax=Polaribacter aquimarinus TaxID=2100726 RepID=A0A2U2JEG4_9FLAO|nr:hybrid sensor histidine kinase/response regulator transcription factor [Polaribacter aquimarinus]PWG06737.1 hybrid sensor histidine kinase/response regulator [Polaribacter aquimarinus]
MHRILKLFCFQFFYIFIGFCFAQNKAYKFTQITEANGLSQNSIIAIHQDKLGQVWIGTKDGLNKYDGEEFKVFKHQKENKNSISNNGILSIEEEEGFIWVGTSFGLNRYDPKKNVFKKYFINEKKKFLGRNMIWAVKKLSNGQLWIGSSNGISIYDKKSDTFKQILDKKRITSIYETKSGSVFIGTTNGMLQLSSSLNDNYYFTTIKHTEELHVNDIIESKKGTILLGTQTKNVLEYNQKKGELSPYFTADILINKNKNVRKLLFDDKDFLWIATYNGLQVSKNKQNLVALYNNDEDHKSINDNFIKTLFKDNMGSVWVGTYYGGLNIWNSFNKNFIDIAQKTSKEGLSFKVVSAIKKYKDYLFFGTEGGGITILNKKTNDVAYITTKNAKLLKSDNIKALCITKNEKLWIGTFTNGISIYNLKTKAFEQNPFPERLVAFLKNVGVLSIVQYDEHHILLGTNYKGLIKYNLKKNSFKLFDSNSKPKGLTNNNIKSLKVDSKKNICVGTLRGLNIISTKEEVTRYIYESDLKVKFEINTIFEDKNGTLWIGTFEDGLFKFNNDQFEPIDLKIGEISVNGIRSIVEAENNTFWISTYTQGLLKYNHHQNKIVSYYTNKEGLISNQFNRDASLRVGTSEYYFGGPSGVTYFNENNLVENTYTPQVIITDFKVNNQSISVDKQKSVLKNTISYTKEIELNYNQGNFNLSFAIPNFINPESNSYVYRLKGLDTDWIKTTNNYASYTIQKPGNYTFEVKGINSDGFINNTPTLLQIKVNPAPWFSYWAYTFYALIIGITLYFLFRILKSKTKLKYQLELEQIKAEEIEKINNSKIEFFTNLSHEFRTPLTLITGPLQQILDNYRGGSQMFKKLKVIENNSNQLLNLISRLMDFRKYEKKLMTLQASENNIVEFVKEIYLSFSEYAKSKNYEYTFHTSSENIKIYFDSVKLESVFFNLISNAFKYTPEEGVIGISIIEKNDKVIISISDTGIGIPEDYRNKIFDRFFEISNKKVKNDYKKGTGIGLSIVKNILNLHKGKIHLTSNTEEENSGSVFSVEFLKGKAHLSSKDIAKDNFSNHDISFYENQLKENHSIEKNENYFEEVFSEQKASILLVEDNEELRTFMRNFLIETYNVFEAENGKIAYKIAKNEPIDIIVSDVVMPITSGTELCTLIKEDIRTSHIPVVLLTTRSLLMYKLEGLEYGADDYISKPFNIKEFKLRISNMLKSITRLKRKVINHPITLPDDLIMSSLDEKLYKKALNIIEKNISNEQFDILFFCEELGVSKTVLFTKVKAWTDFTPKQFIQYIRLNRAAILLEQGKMNITQVSTKVGFRDRKYFSRIFKSKFGKTPKEYAESFLEY